MAGRGRLVKLTYLCIFLSARVRFCLSVSSQQKYAMRLRVEVRMRATQLPWEQMLKPGRSIVYDLLAREAPEVGRQFHAGDPGCMEWCR